jgi:hypothetical protein
MEGYDVKFVGPKVWDTLHGWYGGGPAIPRFIIIRGYQESIELYPQPCLVRLTTADGSPAEEAHQVLMPRSATAATVIERCQAALKCAPGACRLWVKVRDCW